MRHKQKELKVESRKLKVLGVAILLTFTFSLSTVSAQESVNATGGNASGSGGSASYSVGQVFYTTNTGTNSYSIAEGVQQPYEISVVIGIEQAKGINLECLAYPNPTTDFLTLQVDASTMFSIQSMEYKLFDINGNLIKREIITGDKTQINMQNFVPATYFLKVVQGNKKVKTFKIIKN